MGRRWDRARGTRQPFGHQVAAAVAGMLVLVVAIAAMAIVLVLKLHGNESRANDRDDAYLTATQSAALGAKAIANDQRGFLLSGDERFVVEAHARIARVHADLATARAAGATATERQTIDIARAGFDAWIQRLDDEVALYRSGDHHAAISASMGPDRDLRKSYEDEFARAQAAGRQHLSSDNRSLAAAASRTIYLLITGLIVALVVGVGIGEWLLRTVLRPVEHLVELLYLERQTGRPAES